MKGGERAISPPPLTTSWLMLEITHTEIELSVCILRCSRDESLTRSVPKYFQRSCVERRLGRTFWDHDCHIKGSYETTLYYRRMLLRGLLRASLYWKPSASQTSNNKSCTMLHIAWYRRGSTRRGVCRFATFCSWAFLIIFLESSYSQVC